MLYKPTFGGTYNMRCAIKDPEGSWGDYSYEDVIWTGEEETQIITFTFSDVEAGTSYNRFEVKLSAYDGPSWTSYTAHDDVNTYFVVEGEWVTLATLDPATLDAPADGVKNYYLNSDWLAEFTWNHELDIEYHTVWFGPTGAMVEQTDRSRYSIISLKWYNGTTLKYDTEYEWKVVTNDGGYEVESETWTLNTIEFTPPISGASGGAGGASGENNMVTLKRLVAAARDKIWYEDI